MDMPLKPNILDDISKDVRLLHGSDYCKESAYLKIELDICSAASRKISVSDR